MARLFFSSQNCRGVETDTSSYNADRSGFIHVEDSHDLRALKAGGYIEAGSVRTNARKHWVCDNCDWDANINSCPKCGSEDLRKVEV